MKQGSQRDGQKRPPQNIYCHNTLNDASPIIELFVNSDGHSTVKALGLGIRGCRGLPTFSPPHLLTSVGPRPLGLPPSLLSLAPYSPRLLQRARASCLGELAPDRTWGSGLPSAAVPLVSSRFGAGLEQYRSLCFAGTGALLRSARAYC